MARYLAAAASGIVLLHAIIMAVIVLIQLVTQETSNAVATAIALVICEGALAAWAAIYVVNAIVFLRTASDLGQLHRPRKL